MKKRVVQVCTIMVVLLLLAGCGLQGSGPDSPADPPAPTEPGEPTAPGDPEGTEPDFPEPPVSEFSLIGNDGVLTLKAWEDELQADAFLGRPGAEEVIQLENADTFTGSWLKTQEFDRLQLQWFSPKGDGERFWLMNMRTDDPDYRTLRNIGVGSTRLEMEEAYPEIQQTLDGRTDPDNSAYEWVDQAEYNYGWFEVEDGVVREVRLEHLFP